MRRRRRKQFGCSTINLSKAVLSPLTKRERRNREAGLHRQAEVVIGLAHPWVVAAADLRVLPDVLQDRPPFELPLRTSFPIREATAAAPIAHESSDPTQNPPAFAPSDSRGRKAASARLRKNSEARSSET